MDPYHAVEGLVQVKMIFPGGVLKVGGEQALFPHHTWKMRLGDWETMLRPAGQEVGRVGDAEEVQVKG